MPGEAEAAPWTVFNAAQKDRKRANPGDGRGTFLHTRPAPPPSQASRLCESQDAEGHLYHCFHVTFAVNRKCIYFSDFLFFSVNFTAKTGRCNARDKDHRGGWSPAASRSPRPHGRGRVCLSSGPAACRLLEGRPAHGPSPVSLEPQALRDAPGHPSSPGGPEATCMNAGRPTGSRRPQVLPAPSRRVTSQ